MPILEADTLQPVGIAPQMAAPDKDAQPSYSWSEIGDAAARDNSLVSLFIDADERSNSLALEAQPDYAPTDDDFSGYEDAADAIVRARSPADLARIKRRVDRERHAHEVLGNSGWSGLAASLAAGVLDPVNFIPVGGSLTKSATVGRRVWESAKYAGRAGLLSSTASEAILQNTQMTRDVDDALLNISAGTFLSGALGAGVGLLPKGGRAELAEAFKEEVMDARRVYHGGSGQSVGAAAFRVTTPEQESLKGSFGVIDLSSGKEHTIVGNPLARIATSPSTEARRIGRELAEQPFIYKGEEDGVAGPIAVETHIKTWDAGLFRAIQDVENAFIEHRFGKKVTAGQMRAGIQDITGRRGDKLTYDEFSERVARAARRGDVDEIPEVAKAARAARVFFDALKDEAIHLKLLPKDVKPETAASYFSRVYNTRKIVQQRPQFRQILVDWLAENESDMDPGDLISAADDIIDNILGNHGEGIWQPIANKRGPLKERTLTIADEAIEDFLINDTETILRVYKRKMAADVELTRAFGKADMLDAIERLREDYKRVRDGVTDPKKLEQIQARFDSDVHDLEAIRDRLRGTYRLPDDPSSLAVRAGRAVRTLNYLRLGGMFGVGSITDVARTVAQHGFMRVMRTGLVPLIKATGVYRQGFGLAKKQVQLAGTALDYVLDSRAASFAELSDEFGRYSKFERGVQYLGNKFGILNAQSIWTAEIKKWYGLMSQTRMLEAADALANGKATKAEISYLANLGIDLHMASRIHRQASEFGFADEVMRWADTERWGDREAVTALRAALVKDVDRGIVSVGQEKPLWMSSELGKAVSQFRSFTFAAQAKALGYGLQRRDAAQLVGLIPAVALGALAYRLKVRDEHRSDDPAVWVKEGIDRSGALGWFFEANGILEKMTANRVGVSRLLGQEPTSRFQSRDMFGTILGPSAGLLFDDIPQLSRALVTTADPTSDPKHRWSASDTHRLRKVLPYQNLWMFRDLVDGAEDDVNELFEIPDRRKPRRPGDD